MSKKIKGLLVLGDIPPRSKSNLLETFVSNRYQNFFSSKTAKKPSEHGWLFLHSMSLKHALLRYNTVTLLHQTLSKRILKKVNYPQISPKTNKKPPLENSKPENMLKMTHVRSKKQKFQKKNKKGFWFWEILIPEPRVIC